jgi:hypothetical protein
MRLEVEKAGERRERKEKNEKVVTDIFSGAEKRSG